MDYKVGTYTQPITNQPEQTLKNLARALKVDLKIKMKITSYYYSIEKVIFAIGAKDEERLKLFMFVLRKI